MLYSYENPTLLFGQHVTKLSGKTYCLFSLSFSFIFFNTLISSLAASRYLPTFRIIFKATRDLPLQKPTVVEVRRREKEKGWDKTLAITTDGEAGDV